MANYTSNGGGATHIAKVTGQLKDLSSNLSDILMVSGGGGGGLLADDEYPGKNAGGISGSGDNSADQSTGNAFGQGESGTNASGGGSGLYGGYKGTSAKSGGAGSGYIGNSLLSNKKMVGYNVPTSSAKSTKTESVNEASENPVSGKPKIGNGFARIKFITSPIEYDVLNHCLSTDLSQAMSVSGNFPTSEEYVNNQNKILFSGQSNKTLPILQGNTFQHSTEGISDYPESVISLPLDGQYIITSINFKATLLNNTYSKCDSWCYENVVLLNSDGSSVSEATHVVWNWVTHPERERNIEYQVETNFSKTFSNPFKGTKWIRILWSYGLWEIKDIKMIGVKIS